MKSKNRFHPCVRLQGWIVFSLGHDHAWLSNPKVAIKFFVPPKKDVKMSKLNCKYLCTQIYLLVGWKARTKSKRYLSEQSVLQRIVLGENKNCLSKWKDSVLKEVWSRFIARREQIGKWRSVPGIILNSNEALVDESPFGTIFLNFVKFFCRR